MNNATSSVPGPQDPVQDFYTPCGYKHVMKLYPKLHGFLVKVREDSGNKVAVELWSFIVDNHIKPVGLAGFRDIGPVEAAAPTVPDECREEGEFARIDADMKTVRAHAAYFWELAFTRCIQLSRPDAHPIAV